MPLSSPEIYDRLLALRSSLIDDKWGTVQSPVRLLFNELLVCTQRLRPTDPVLRSIGPAKTELKPATLCTLVDQMLVALSD